MGSFFCLNLASGCATFSPRSTAESQIRQSLNQWPQDISNGNVVAACSLFAKNTVLTFPGQPDRGYDETCARIGKMIGSKALKYDPPQIEEIKVAGDLAFVRLIWTAYETLPNGKIEITKEKGLDVFEKQQDGVYRIRVSHAFPIK